MYKIKTYLPVFPGFYNTIFEPYNEDSEVDEINNIREEKGLSEITFDDCEFNYDEYFTDVAEKCTDAIEAVLIELDLIKSIEFEKLVSPEFYNYTNDSINITINLSDVNLNNILKYINNNLDEFAEYIRERYTSCSGFISSYSNNYQDWINKESIEHKHKLGSIFEFILLIEEYDQESLYYDCEDIYIFCSNYNELTEGCYDV